MHLNCAVSRNGRLAAEDGAPVLYSGPEDLHRVHALRAQSDGILVGASTVRSDDPSLRVKPEHADGPDPIRIVWSTDGELPPGARIFDGTAPTVVVTGPKATTVLGAQQVRVPLVDGRISLPDALEALAMRGLRSVLVEGGEQILRAFLAAGAWDEFTVYVAPGEQGGDGPALWREGPAELGFSWKEEPLGDGVLMRFSRA